MNWKGMQWQKIGWYSCSIHFPEWNQSDNYLGEMTVKVLADIAAAAAVAAVVDPVPASDLRCPVCLPSPTLQPHIVLKAADQLAAVALGTLRERGGRAGRA